MRASHQQLLLSATDLANHLGCHHLTTLEHVVFPWGENVTEEALTEVLEKLRAGASPDGFGRSLLVAGRRLPRQSRADLLRSLGADFADRVKSLPEGEWQGPVESTRGVHLVRVIEAAYREGQADEGELITSFRAACEPLLAVVQDNSIPAVSPD